MLDMRGNEQKQGNQFLLGESSHVSTARLADLEGKDHSLYKLD